MKKILLSTLILALVFALFVPCFANAETLQNNGTFAPEGQDYKLVTLLSDGKPVGARLVKIYFGEIETRIDVYSSQQMPLDFYLGNTNLSASQLQTRNKLVEIFNDIDDFMQQVDVATNSTYTGKTNSQGETLPISDVYRFNQAVQGDKVEISKISYEMLQIAKEMYQSTNGAFNPAVYRLVDLWGFSSRIYSQGNFGEPYDRIVTAQQFAQQGYPLPEQKYVDAFSNADFVNFDHVALSEENGKYFATKNCTPAVVDGVQFQQWIDLGGIAKGYAVDYIRSVLQSNDLPNYFVDCGVSSQSVGKGVDGKDIELAFSDSFDPMSQFWGVPLFSVNVANNSISTSGQYVRKYTTNGITYSHIVDAKTGAPAQTGVESVAVILPNDGTWATQGDCLTTALTVMGKNEIVDFVNGYAKQHGIYVVVCYKTVDGQKQILSNFSKQQIVAQGENFNNYQWALQQGTDGNFAYDESIPTLATHNYQVILVVAGIVLSLAIVAIVVYHFVWGKRHTFQNVKNAKKDKPFKPADVGVYMLVALLVLVLFSVFFGQSAPQSIQYVKVVEIESGNVLFVYNVARNEYQIGENANVDVQKTDNGLSVTITQQIDGEERFNTFEILLNSQTSVKMTQSICGFHQDCVYNFPALSQAGGTIVCSPNGLKIITE